MIAPADRAILAALLGHAPQPIWVHQARRVIYANRAMISLLQAPSEDALLGRSPLDFFPAEIHGVVGQRIAAVLDQNELQPPVEESLTRLDGTSVPVETSRWKIEVGGRPANQSVFLDLTARKNVDRQLAETELKFRLLFENSKDAMGISVGEQLTFANPMYAKLFGYDEPSEMVGIRLPDLIAPSHRPEVLARWEKRKQGEAVPNVYEARLRRKDGSEFDGELRLSTTPSNGLLYMLATVRDITAQKRYTASREFLLAKFSAVLDNMTEGMLIAGPESRMIELNPAALAIHGMPIDGPSTMTLAELGERLEVRTLDGQVVPPEEYPLARALRGERFLADEYELYRRDTGRRWVGSYGGTRVLDPQGKPVAALVTVRDITAQRQAAKALRESEARFRMIADNIPQMAWIVDQTGSVTWYNQRWYDYTGTTFEEMQGLGWQQVQHPDHLPRVMASLQAAFGAGESWEETFPLLSASGEYRWFLTRAVPARNEHGEIESWFGTNTDITETREAEAALRDSEQRKSAILESALDCIITIDGHSRILEFNPAAEQTFGISRAEAVGQQLPELIIPPQFREAHRHGLARYLRTGEGPVLHKRVELNALRADGTEFPVELAIFPIAGQDSVSFTATLRDITERRQSEEELRNAKLQAEAANQAKSSFLASMSHELRTPLNAIIGYGEMLQEEAGDLGAETLVPDLQKIHTAGKHLLALINDVLDLSKIEAGKMELFLETFDVEDMLHDVVSTAQTLFEKNHNEFRVAIPKDLGTLRADQTKVRQSLFNLLSNAAKFTENGVVVLRAARNETGDKLLFQVTDSGIGLSPEQVGRLFEAFQQADAGTSRRFGGTGLGLALTRRFLQMMGGDVSVDSVPGQGSTFTISLPSAQPESAPAVLPALDSASCSGTVLVIDDDPTARDLLRRLLVKEGFHAETASNGEDGLRMARNLRPVAITLDVMMPHMDGWSVLSALKADPELEHIPVIMLTMVDNRNLGYTLGATEYLTKPVQRDQLAAILNRYRCQNPPCPVLIVDDDPDARRLLRHALEAESWVVYEAGNGREALDQMARQVPELILLDLMMPEMDGFEFSMQLCRDAEWCKIPIVVLTAMNLTPEDRARLNGHVERVLQKTAFTQDELLAEVRRAVGQCTARL